MYPFKDSHIIMDNDNLYKILENFEIKSALDLKNDKQLISYKANTEEDEELTMVPNINVSIAAAIKAYARILKSQLKKKL